MAIALTVAYQLSGIGVVSEYAKQLFLVIEEGNEREADDNVLILGYFQVISVFASGYLITKFGRRPIMIIGMVIICVSLLCACLSSAILS